MGRVGISNACKNKKNKKLTHLHHFMINQANIHPLDNDRRASFNFIPYKNPS